MFGHGLSFGGTPRTFYCKAFYCKLETSSSASVTLRKFFVLLGVARRLELSPCNTEKVQKSEREKPH